MGNAIVGSKLENARPSYHGSVRRIDDVEEKFNIEKIGYFMQVQSACGVAATSSHE